MEVLTKKFRDIGSKDLPMVGGKNASLGAMYNNLSSEGVKIPNGFATTAHAFWLFMKENEISERLKKILDQLDRTNYSNLSEIGEKARKIILQGKLSEELSLEIVKKYKELSDGEDVEVAVRSSATAEDLPQASFAGQHDTFLNVLGEKALLNAVLKCFASLFTDRAIKYREDQGFNHLDIALSVGIQKMVRSDKGCSGIGFTLDPESGSQKIIHISGTWGLGDNIVQGAVNPDEFYIFKNTLISGFNAILQKKLGTKEITLVYAQSNGHSSTINLKTEKIKQNSFVLNNIEIMMLANWALKIENFYKKPMDIEWAKDGITNELFITQARPETVHGGKKVSKTSEFILKEKGEVLSTGSAIGNKITSGTARFLESPQDSKKLNKGDILVTNTTSPDWDPLFKKASAVVTNKGGRTSHAAIVARELGVPAVVGTKNATEKIEDGSSITVSCAQGNIGYIYKGELKYETRELDFKKIKLPKTEAKLILSNPEQALKLSLYPNNGVGLLRMEFIITHIIKAHPMALVNYDKISDKETKEALDELTKNYTDKKEYFVDQLSQGIAMIAAAFYPNEVILRTSDFKTNEYAKLLGGTDFEPVEENPMLGFRGASRYYDKLYQEGFKLECAAIKRVREEMGLTNLKVMIPFCRTLTEAKKVIDEMANNGLTRGEKGFEIFMMVEIPSNVLLLDDFAELFDGFSIGSNDLTQLTLGLDRDSEYVSHIFDENNSAARKMVALAIKKAKRCKKVIGFCGQAPSDFPEYSNFLIKEGITSISFNQDAFINGIQLMNKSESEKDVHYSS